MLEKARLHSLQAFDGGVQRVIALGKTKAHKPMVGLSRTGVAVKRRQWDHTHTVLWVSHRANSASGISEIAL